MHDELSVTSVFVTHDQDEALEVADRIAVMNEGRIEQEGTPDEVYDNPENPFVYNFLGNVNLFHGRVHGGKIKVGEHELDAAETGHAEQTNVIAYVRPHDIEISRQRDENFAIFATIRHINAAGPVVRINLQRHDNGEQFEAELTRDRYKRLSLKNHESVYVRVCNPRVFEDYVI